MKKYLIFMLFLLIISFLALPLYGESYKGQKSISKEDLSSTSVTKQAVTYTPMPDPGKKVPIGNGYYLIYNFNKKPKLGTVIMKVDIYTAEDKKGTSLVVKADAGMPSMRGAHETGDRPFQLSKNGSYLLPISIVMPGDWEIRLTVLKDGQVIFRGRYNFDV
jgi:hypothetical protein